MKIGIIKEGKVPSDSRVPLTPEQCAHLKKEQSLDLVVQRSDIRCFKDEEYAAAGVKLVDEVEDCDILLGVKEVPIDMLIADKTYFFFSHTIKKQEYNKGLLQEILQKNIRLLDYEVLVGKNGGRVIAFGIYAGMVGAHNALWTWGKRTGSFELSRMSDVREYLDAKKEYSKIQWPAVKIVLTGTGRVGQGAALVLRDMGIREVDHELFLGEDLDEAVFTQIDALQYARAKDGSAFTKEYFYKNPEAFESAFRPYASAADIFINGIYWDNAAPAFFTREDMSRADFNIKVIADITCDIAPVSSIPSTLRATTIPDPVFGYDPQNNAEIDAFDPKGVDMMTIDNLPNEMPRDASQGFGEQFIKNVLPELIKRDSESKMLTKATIAQKGQLGPHFQYLKDWVEG